MSYYEKYLKYKKKYFDLKNHNKIETQKGGSELLPKDYYIVHGASSFINMCKILDIGKIKPGKLLSKTYRKLGKLAPLADIYCNIYFKDLDNLEELIDYSLIFKPNILLEMNSKINKNWSDDNIVEINISDDLETKERKIQLVKEYISNNKNQLGYLSHEVTFNKPIDIEKYLLAVICRDCSEEKRIILKKYLKRAGLDNVKILDSNKLKNIE